MQDYKYPIPQYVESTTLLGGSIIQLLIFAPFLAVGIILFLLLDGGYRFFWPALTIGMGYILAFQKLDRETFAELILSHLAYLIKPKTLYWERMDEG
ncbi:hypothetical protein J6TS7_32450 [Paenibacillus dendritiformis]|uniref:hypothetical protein n=1 Tax=Paenibacillus TaxID=44249 RepID=UPI001B0B3772|nr:hypothetical protein [Paenibacillus dendritiformis]GIO79635.1 hypothetical protein J6TS7_32450 [Paenibacillus dendritiformis]